MRLLLLFSIIIIAAACNSNKATHNKADQKDSIANVVIMENDSLDFETISKIRGNFNGLYGKKTIHFHIEYVGKRYVIGEYVYGSVTRNIFGNWEKDQNNNYKIILKEPGDKADDGVFNLTLLNGDSFLKGFWMPNDKGKYPKVPVKLSMTALKPDLDMDLYSTEFTRRFIPSEQWAKNYKLKFFENKTFEISYYLNFNDDNEQEHKTRGTWNRVGLKLFLKCNPMEPFLNSSPVFKIVHGEYDEVNPEIDAANGNYIYLFGQNDTMSFVTVTPVMNGNSINEN